MPRCATSSRFCTRTSALLALLAMFALHDVPDGIDAADGCQINYQHYYQHDGCEADANTPSVSVCCRGLVSRFRAVHGHASTEHELEMDSCIETHMSCTKPQHILRGPGAETRFPPARPRALLLHQGPSANKGLLCPDVDGDLEACTRMRICASSRVCACK